MKRIFLCLLPLALIATSSAQSVKALSCIGAPMPALKGLLGAPVPQPKYSQYTMFRPAGFDQVMVDKPGAAMKHIEFTFGHMMAGRVALGYIGLVGKGTSIKVLKDVSGPNSMTRNLTEFTGVGGLPAEKSKGPWRVFYQEVGILNKGKLDALEPKVKTLSGNARMNLIRSCYEWHSKLMLLAPSAVPSDFKRM